MRRGLTAAAGAVVAIGLVAGCSSSPAEPPITSSPAVSTTSPGGNAERLPQGEPFDVTLADMTIHSFQGKPETNSGGFRMNCSPRWNLVEPKKGQYDWAVFDAALAKTESWGAETILYTFCGTPKWAAGKVKDPSSEILGAGSTSAPRNIADFADYAKAVAERYKGRIDAYEVWNEASSPQFYQGTPQQMAEMTAAARQVIKKADPKAIVTAASTQTHNPLYYSQFFPPYLKALQKLKWPVDVWNAHFYPSGKGGPAARRKQIAMVRATLAKAKAPDKPLWDTEVNYFTGVPGGEPDGRITGPRAAAWAVRTYLDGWRLDVARNYWYFWTQAYEPFPGIQTRPGDPATLGLAQFSDWVVGSRFNGCEQDKKLVRCAFAGADGDFFIAWGESGDDQSNARVAYPLKGGAEVCRLLDATCSSTKALTIDEVPVKITPTD